MNFGDVYKRQEEKQSDTVVSLQKQEKPTDDAEPVSYTHLDVYKRQVWEIAELLNVTGTAVKNTIKRIWKQSVQKDFQHSQYVKLENGYSAHVLSLIHI